jgi:HSP20 family molecular chaperone IbpA
MFDTTFARDVQQTLDHFRRSVDQLFGSTGASSGYNNSDTTPAQTDTERVFSPVVETGWNEHEMMIRAVLPGVGEKDVNVSLRGNQLIIEGQRQAPGNWSKGAYTQLAYGRFYAAITLPQGLNLEKLGCKLHEGLLDISIPIAEQMKPRQIPVNTGTSQATITA